MGPKYYKIKWHHLLHLPDDLRRMGKLLSCFPMERKHKDIKVQMVNAFRSIEKATVFGYLNANITAMLNGLTKFSDHYLVNPFDDHSLKAVLHIGRVSKDDLVLFNIDLRGNKALGKILEFIAADGALYAHLAQFAPCSPRCWKVWDASTPEETIVVSKALVGICMYRLLSPTVIRIIDPAMS